MGNTTEREQQMYWMHQRGVIITLPEPITRQISGPIARGEDVDPLELHRLSIIDDDSIMKKRLPSSVDGIQYMERVDLLWREQLLKEAKIMTEAIRAAVLQNTGISEKDFAIIVFGSIARGLSKNRHDADPSNIDLSVIGDFSDEQRILILNAIRPARDQGGERIGNNVGVFVQTPEKVTKNEYAPVLQFIGACAYPLYDPGNIWGDLEREALQFSLDKRRQTATKKYGASNKAQRFIKESRLALVAAI